MSTDIPISKSLCFTLLNYSSQKFITSCPQLIHQINIGCHFND